MRKRFLCMILAAAVLLSLIPVFALPARAASNMKTSEACIAILKKMEGFAKYPYFDYEHYSVGYGSTCQEGDYPDGITEEEADAELRKHLGSMEGNLNYFADKNGIILAQYQFDALMLFTYNCGIGWMYSDGEMRQAVLDNATGNDFIYPLTLWSVAGGSLSQGLLNRRLREANMYLNGSYETEVPVSYTYAYYNNNGGTGGGRVHGYDYNQRAQVRGLPTREGYVFLGWYSEPEGGEWVRYLTAAHSRQTLYAHWQSAEADPAVGTPASYQIPAVELPTTDTYDTPGGTAGGSLALEAMAVVEADYVDEAGVKWGRLASGRWVKLGDPRCGIREETVVEEGVRVNITGDYVNIRTGPGEDYPVVAGVAQGDAVALTRVVQVEEALWGKCRAGWLCLEFTDYAGGLPVEEPDGDYPQIPGTPVVPKEPKKPVDTVIATGTVTANKLAIRSKAGSQGTPVGSYSKGDRVELFEITGILGFSWGRTDKGWITLTYVKLDEKEKSVEHTVPEDTVPEETAPPEEETVPRGQPGTVISKSDLNVRSGPSKDYKIIDSYSPGQKIWILEQRRADGILWGRTEYGWVYMQYVSMSQGRNGAACVEGVVAAPEGLTIRSGAGAGHVPVGAYPEGTRIQIFEQLVVAGQRWGRTDDGWVCMEAVELDASEAGAGELPAEILTGTVMADSLNIRTLPGADGEIVGEYSRNQSITILEVLHENGAAWGLTDRGWISLIYVDINELWEAGNGFPGEITSDMLCIRMGPGNGYAVVGMYRRGDVVTILEQTRVGVTRWGRTNQGWICMDHVK